MTLYVVWSTIYLSCHTTTTVLLCLGKENKALTKGSKIKLTKEEKLKAKLEKKRQLKEEKLKAKLDKKKGGKSKKTKKGKGKYMRGYICVAYLRLW